MTALRGPRQGTRAYEALYKLHLIGGRVSSTDWLNAICWEQSVRTFKRDIVGRLHGYELIGLNDDLCSLTDAGIDFLGIDRDALAGHVPAMAGPRYVPNRGDLSAKNMAVASCGRPGAFDYRDIPSRIGSERVPFVAGNRTSGIGNK